MDIKAIEQMILLIAMIALGIMIILSLIISIRGPRFTDRLVAVSAINTIVDLFICMLAVYFGKGYIFDIALVYGMIGFISTVVLAKLKLRQYLEDNNMTISDGLKAVRSNDGNN